MNYDYYLFDWDGCLARTLEVWLDACRQGYKEFGVELSDQEIARHFGDWQAPAKYGIADVEGCMKRIAGLAEIGLADIALYDGAKELLTELKKTKRLALLSSSKRVVIEQGIDHTGLTGIFDVIITSDDVTHHKPHPEIIYKALATFGAEPAQAVMLGDSRKDLEAAKNAGVDSILVYPENHSIFYDLDELKTYQPTYIVSGFAELLSKV